LLFAIPILQIGVVLGGSGRPRRRFLRFRTHNKDYGRNLKASVVATSRHYVLQTCVHTPLRYIWLTNSRASSRVVLIGQLHFLGTISKHIESVDRQHIILHNPCGDCHLPIIMRNALRKGCRHYDELSASKTPFDPNNKHETYLMSCYRHIAKASLRLQFPFQLSHPTGSALAIPCPFVLPRTLSTAPQS